MNEPQQLITRREIATLAGVSPSAVTNWISRHRDTFPPSLDGTHFDAAAVRQWLVEQGRMPEDTDEHALARTTALTLVGLMRQDLDPQRAIACAATQVTMFHLDPTSFDHDPMQVAERLEAGGSIAARALTEVLRGLPQLMLDPSGSWAPAKEALTKSTAAGVALSDVFDAVLSQVGSAGRFVGEHSTPPDLVGLAVGLLPPTYSSVLDPACGFGDLLVGAANRDGLTRAAMGFDIDPIAHAISIQNALLHGVRDADIRQDDSLEWLPAAEERLDAVICQPPFGMALPEGSAALRWAKAELGRGVRRTDLIWVLLAQRMLTRGGRAVVLTAPGTLFAGATEERIRIELLRTRSVEAVISIPAGHLAGTALGVAVWVVGAPGTCGDEVLMADLDSDDVADPSAFLQELAQWRAGGSGFDPQPGRTALVPVLDLMGESVNLTPRQWVQRLVSPDDFIEDVAAELTQLAESLATLPGESSLPAISLPHGPTPELKRLSQLEALGLLTVLRDRALRRQASKDAEGEAVYSSLSSQGQLRGNLSIESVPAGALRTQPGDVVLQTTGTVRATVDREGGHLVADPLCVIRPTTDDPRVAPDVLALLLSSPRVDQLTVGTTIQRLRLDDVTIPLLERADAEQLASVAGLLHGTRAAALEVANASGACLAALVGAVENGVRIQVDVR